MTIQKNVTWLIAMGLLLISPLAQAATLSPSSLTMLVGKNATIKVSSIRGTASLSQPTAAVVNAELKVSGSSGTISVTSSKTGSATLTFKDRNGTKSIKVTVAKPMTLSGSSLSLSQGGTGSITVSNATGEIRLNSTNSEVASASLSDKNVKVEAKSAGTTTITVKDSLTTLQFTVTVIAGTDPGTISNTTNGRLLASNCFQCHGTYGSGGFDELMGKDIYGELMEYVNGSEDPDGIMAAHLKGYTAQQLEAIADYFVNP